LIKYNLIRNKNFLGITNFKETQNIGTLPSNATRGYKPVPTGCSSWLCLYRQNVHSGEWQILWVCQHFKARFVNLEKPYDRTREKFWGEFVDRRLLPAVKSLYSCSDIWVLAGKFNNNRSEWVLSSGKGVTLSILHMN